MKKIFLLFCAAAGWLGAQAQTEALELPFYETFPDTVDVDAEDAQWTVLDNNGDGYQYEWGEYLSASFDPATGCASLQGSQTLASDDYLATKPIRMEQGTAHISFYFTGGYSDDLKETMDVLFGASDAELTALPAVLCFLEDPLMRSSTTLFFFGSSLAIGWVRGGRRVSRPLWPFQ